MSKIYEALLRAEQERIAAGGTPKAQPSDLADSDLTDSEAALSDPAQLASIDASAGTSDAPAPVAPARTPSRNPSRSQPAPHTPSFEAPSPRPAVYSAPIHSVRGSDNVTSASDLIVPAGAPRLDAANIRVKQWKPVIEKLPALEERGNAVEQFRSLRTRLFGFRDLNTLKSIMVSSGLPREGKSFIAANLAVSFARHKAARVLLIDGDMRRSSLHNVLGCEKSPGLTTYLAGHASMTDVMQRPQLQGDGSPLAAGLASLTFIGGGDEGDVAADLSGSARFRQLIESASTYFDWIVVDSSPVNLVTDSVNLAAACDAVLMVARGGVTKFEAAQRALAELKASKILGVVLNAVDEPTAVSGYYGYEGYDGYDSVKTDQHPPAELPAS